MQVFLQHSIGGLSFIRMVHLLERSRFTQLIGSGETFMSATDRDAFIPNFKTPMIYSWILNAVTTCQDQWDSTSGNI